MDERTKAIKQKLKDDFEHYALKCLRIRTKSGAIDPFVLNKAQKYIHERLDKQLRETGKVRALILKGRQQGCSTYIGARLYHKVTHSFGMQAFILTHSLEATNNLFKMAKRFYENTPDLVRPSVSASNSKELVFGSLDSGYKLGTAENKNVGRSSTIQLAHFSECAFWNNAADHAVGIMQAIPNADNTEVIMESTANGVGNYFHQEWQKAESGISEFQAIFIPWYWQDEYKKRVDGEFSLTPEEEQLKTFYGLSNEQLNWRRSKIVELSVNGMDGQKAFKQEYPCIVGSQRVGTSLGLIPIEEVVGGSLSNQGIVKKQWFSGEKETVIITTSLGYRLECTLEHRIATVDSFIEAQHGLNQTIRLAVPMFAAKEMVFDWHYMPCIKSSTIINEDMALFLGFFMGDGSYYGDTLSIAFDARDLSSIQVVHDLFVKLFGKTPESRKTSENGWELRAGLKNVKKFFLALGIVEKHCAPNGDSYIKRAVKVPNVIWKSPRHVIKQFLRGLFDADGFAGYHAAKIAFFTKHEQFAIDIQLLLLGFGVTCKRGRVVTRKKNKDKEYFGNELILRAAESRLFGMEIGFVSDRKNARVAEWLDIRDSGRRQKEIELVDCIISVKSNGAQKVYDLEMTSQPHVFDAQGILVHNCNSGEAFQLTGEDSYIPSEIVMRARKCFIKEKSGPLVIGVDPARFGDDRSAIIRRQGRFAYGLESHVKKDTMELVGLVHNIIMNESPALVCVDVGGLGAGVVDRLVELGHGNIVRGINAGSSPLDGNKYANKRAEMWGLLLEWLKSEPCTIPDDDALHADLCGIRYRFDSNSRLVMESKADMKKRGVRSSDLADSLCLTLAVPMSAFGANNRDEKVKSLASTLSKQLNAKRTLRNTNDGY